MGIDNHELGEFTGAGFDQLRDFLKPTTADSPQALATLDLADNFEMEAIMMAGGSLASRLADDRHNFPTGNFNSRTDPMFADEDRNRQKTNEIVDLITLRQSQDPTYAKTINFLLTTVVRGIDRSSSDHLSVKMGRVSEGFRAVVAEVCAKPKKVKTSTTRSK